MEAAPKNIFYILWPIQIRSDVCSRPHSLHSIVRNGGLSKLYGFIAFQSFQLTHTHVNGLLFFYIFIIKFLFTTRYWSTWAYDNSSQNSIHVKQKFLFGFYQYCDKIFSDRRYQNLLQCILHSITQWRGKYTKHSSIIWP